MAAVVQKNGMKPLQMVNGNLAHLDVANGTLNVVKLDDDKCVIKTEPGTIKTEPHDDMVPGLYIQSESESERSNSDIVKREYGCSSYLQYNSGDLKCSDNSEADEPEIDIVINNVVCSFSVRCHLNLRMIALKGVNVEYRRENGMVTMKLRKPYTTASIWSSGKITCTGATSEDNAHIAARRFARCLQKLGFKTRFTNYRVVNVLGTCSMPFAIKITPFSEKHKPIAEYEPELHPGVTYKLKKPKATLKIFSTGSITVTAPSVSDVQQAIEEIYPLILEFRTERTKEEESNFEKRRGHSRKRKYSDTLVHYGHEHEMEEEADCDDDDDEVGKLKVKIEEDSEAEDWV